MNETTKNVSMKKGRAALLLAVILALSLILINLLIEKLPYDAKNIDLTQNKIYSVTDATKRSVAKVDEAVSIYLVSVNGETALSDEGVHLHAFFSNAASVNKKISYSLVDPVKDPSWLEKYEFASEMSNLSVVVESQRRSYHIPYSELFSYYVDGVGKISESNAMYYYYYGYTPYYCFDGEAKLLEALTYVTDPDMAVVYALTGHSEPDLSSSAASMIKSAGISPKTLSLSSGASVPADCDLLIINAPQTDITAAEASLLCNYLARGGAILLTTTPEITSMPNLTTVTAYMAMYGVDGIVTEEDGTHYYNSSYPYYLAPIVGSHAVTASVSTALLPFAHGIEFAETLPAGTTVTPILTTSEAAYVIPLDATTPEKPEGAETKTFCVGAVSEISGGGRLIWIPCTNFFSDTADGMISGANSVLLASTVTWTCGAPATAPTANILPLVTETLTVNTATARLLSLMLTIIMPIAIVALGIFTSIRRKRR